MAEKKADRKAARREKPPSPSDALNAPLLQVSANKALLAKINFPREALIVSGIYQTLFNAAIKHGILLLVLPFLGVHPGWCGLLIPVGLLSLVLAGTVVGLLITPPGGALWRHRPGHPADHPVSDGPEPGGVPVGHHGLDRNADAAQPAHTADPQCPRLVRPPAATAAGRMGAGAGRLGPAAACGVAGVPSVDADPDRADECLRPPLCAGWSYGGRIA